MPERTQKGLVLMGAGALGLVLLGVLAGWALFGPAGKSSCGSHFPLINPDIDCDIREAKKDSLASLQKELEDAIQKHEQAGTVVRIGVFARDLRSTRFVGVHENDVFYMASLLKVPLVIGGYKLAEVEPKVLEQALPFTGSGLYDEQFIQPQERLEQGRSYTVKELMRRAAVYSDNAAAQMLFEYYPESFMDRILEALGIELRKPNGEVENPVTPRAYANIFRSLYNASYLTREYANDTLSLLAQSAYKNGALKHLPPDVVVAHKFAERTTVNAATPGGVLRQLHECGLVYAKEGAEPYTFCIMTEGSDFAQLEAILQDISVKIYTTIIEP